MAEFKITKRFSRKITRDYQSWEFMTEITQTENADNLDQVVEKSDKLFGKVKDLTQRDIESCKNELVPGE